MVKIVGFLKTFLADLLTEECWAKQIPVFVVVVVVFGVCVFGFSLFLPLSLFFLSTGVEVGSISDEVLYNCWLPRPPLFVFVFLF